MRYHRSMVRLSRPQYVRESADFVSHFRARRRPLGGLARAGLGLALVGLGLVGCGDTVKIIECPTGTFPEGSQCIPYDTFVPDTAVDATVDTREDTAVDTWTPPDTTPDTGGDTASETDAAETVGGATGTACVKNADCAGGTCLDWTGGYCTTLDCGAGTCGANERCLAYQANQLCVRGCGSDADCRAPDQACKTLVDGGQTVKVCMGVDPGAGKTGAACGDATDCEGRATCLQSFPGGYCSALECDVLGCPNGASCVKVDGRPSCLLRCSGDGDCGGTAGAERRCGVLQGVSGGPVDVCISGVAGKALGATCRSDFECTSGTCQILGEGRCSQTRRPCFTASATTDCNGAEFCQVTADSRVGLCSQPCALGARACPGAAHCLTETADPRVAWCRPACTGGGDTSCNADAGLVCAFGIPVSDSGQGRYACTRKAAGGTLESCTGNATCGGGTCLLDGNNGYCAAVCGEDGHCAFGGACVFGASGDRCQRACFAQGDCPSGFTCEVPSGATRSVCVP